MFNRLVDNLSAEAQGRQLAIASREGAANYRVRGYLAAQVIRGRTHISWVWDVYDGDKLRTLRITGEEPAAAAAPTRGASPTRRCCAGSPAPAWTGSRPSGQSGRSGGRPRSGDRRSRASPRPGRPRRRRSPTRDRAAEKLAPFGHPLNRFETAALTG